MVTYLFPILLLLSVAHSNAQSLTPRNVLDYDIEEFTLPGGRRGNNVNAIVQGPYGFMWFGSHGGLHRYDGYEFVTYKAVPGDTIGETSSLTYPYVEGLFWDSNKILWVTSYGGGLFSFDPITEKFKHYKHDPDDSTSISHPRVLCAVEDTNGNLWFGTEHGLNRLDKATGKFKRYFADPNVPGSLHNDNVRSFYVDKAGTLWIGTGFVLYGTDDGGLSRYNPESDSFTNFFPDATYQAVRGMLEDSRGNFWVGTIKGLHKFDRSTGTFERMNDDPAEPYAPGVNDLEFQPTYSIMEDRNGGLWIGTIDFQSYPTHLVRYDTLKKETQVFPIRSSVWQMCESKDGTIWIAGAGTSGRVQKLKPKTRTYDLHTDRSVILDSYGKSAVYRKLGGFPIGPRNMTVDPKSGNLWLQLLIAQSYGPVVNKPLGMVLAEYNPGTGNSTFHLLDLEMQRIDVNLFPVQAGMRGLIVDKQGKIWGGSYADKVGLYSYDPISLITKTYSHDPDDPESLSSDDISTLFIDSRGEIWASAFENGLNRINSTTGKVTRYHFNKEGFGDNDSPVTIVESRNGKLLIAGNLSYDGACFMVELDPATNTMKKIPLPGFLTNWIVIDMAESKTSGNLAMVIGGNMNGVAYFNGVNNEMFIRDKENGFPFSNAAGIVSDNRGDFWVADAGSAYFVRFANQDDFVFEEANQIPTQWRSGILGANGKVYFTTVMGGWVEIDPEIIAPEIAAESSKIQLVDLFIMGEKQEAGNDFMSKPAWLMNELKLPADAENFGFRF